MKNTKKGFTLVELLVVIAILAILATVAVVGYTSFTEKAEKSADQQGVAQMNTVLNAAQVSDSLVVEGNDALTAINIFKVLVENGYNDELVAYYEKYSFGYIVEDGKAVIVLVENGKVAYPEGNEDKTYKEFFKSVENSDELLDAFDTGYVLLKTDAVFSEPISIQNDLTIVGNNKILDEAHLTYDSSANSTINVNGATEDITVTMSGVTIENTEDTYARGLNLGNNTGKVTLVLEDVTLESYYYALNITASNPNGVEIIVRNSTITGWAAVNVWSKVNVTFENCTIIGNDVSEDNVFGTIVVNSARNGSIAAGSTFTFKNCRIEANSEHNNPNMKHVVVRTDDVSLTFEGCTFTVNGEVSELTTYTQYDYIEEVDGVEVEKSDDFTSSTTITIK